MNILSIGTQHLELEMLLKIVIAVVMIVVTTAVHAVGMMLALNLTKINKHEGSEYIHLWQVYRVSAVVITMFIASILEAVLWAIPYWTLDAIEGIETTIYFSMVTYTTLGYGDVLLDNHWRLLSSFEAANGLIMFGWTTAIVMAAIKHIFLDDLSRTYFNRY